MMRNHGIVGYPSFRQSYMNGNIKILISKDENVGYPIFRQTHTNQDSKVSTRNFLIFAVIIHPMACFQDFQDMAKILMAKSQGFHSE